MKRREKPRGRLNLSFDLTNEAEAAVFHILQQKSKMRQATGFVTHIVLSGLTSEGASNADIAVTINELTKKICSTDNIEQNNSLINTPKKPSMEEKQKEARISTAVATALDFYGD